MTAKPFWIYQQGELWVIDVQSSPLPAPVEPRIEAHFEEVGPPSGDALAQAMGHPHSAEIRQRLAGSQRCFAARVSGEIASYCWIAQEEGHVGEMERIISLRRGAVYIWGCATRPAFRRQHLYTALLSFMSRQLASEGLQHIWIGADLENTPSLRAFESAGFRPVARMTYTRLLLLSAILIQPVSGAPRALVAAARQLFTMPSERRWGPLAIGWRRVR